MVRGWRLSFDQGYIGWVARHGQSLNVADVPSGARHFTGVDEQTGPDLRSILTVPLQIKDRVRSMTLVHETLYRSPDLARFDIAEYIRREVEYLLAAHAGWDRGASRLARVHADVHVDDVLLDIERAIPCGLIVNELISNALKYAFPPAVDRAQGDCDEIRAELLHSDGGLALTVSDNGIGLPVDLDWQNSTSLGLQLVHILSAQIEGRAELDRVGGPATASPFPIGSHIRSHIPDAMCPSDRDGERDQT